MPNINNVRWASSTSKLPSVAVAHWDEFIFGHPPTVISATSANPFDNGLRPVKIHYFAKATFSLNGESRMQEFIFAMFSWFESHDSRFKIGKPVQVWCSNLFENAGLYSFLPLDDLYFAEIFHCVHTCMKLDNSGENVLVVLPVI